RGDHFVAGADAGGQERQVQRARAGVDGDAFRRAAVGGELTFEAGDSVAEDELARFDDARNRGVDVGLDVEILRAKIDKRNHTVHLFAARSTGRPELRIDSVA